MALPNRNCRAAAPSSLTDFDSIARLEFVLAVESAFGIEFAEEELEKITTLDAFDAAVAAKCPAGPPASFSSLTQPATFVVSDPESVALMPLPDSPWHRPARALLLAWLRMWFRLRVTGVEHLPASGAFLIVANHTSHLDSLALLAAVGRRRGDLVFPAARDYFFSGRRLGGLAARMLPLLPFEREGHIGALKQNLRRLEACRATGHILVLFPEGTRSATGELQPFKDGLSFFGGRLRVPVVPCWIDGTFRALPRGAGWPRPGRLRVAFGLPVPLAGDGGAALAAAVRRAMFELRERLP